MNTLLCLTFLQAFQGQTAHIPAQVDHFAKNQIVQQLKAQNNELVYSFDNPHCSAQGTYIYSGEAMILVADNNLWNGRAELPLNDILDGKKLYFAPLLNLHSAPKEPELKSELAEATTAPAKKKKSWLPWVLAGAGVVVGGIIASHSRKNGGGGEPPNPHPAPPPLPVPTSQNALPLRPITIADPAI